MAEKELKSESITFRIPPSHKAWVEAWARGAGRSVGAVLLDLIYYAKADEIGREARKSAHEKAAEFFDFPAKAVAGIETAEDWRGLREMVGEEKYEAYARKWQELNDEAQEGIARDEGFEWVRDIWTEDN